MLLILDNAASSHQVAPAARAAGCMVIVTSRRYLGDVSIQPIHTW